MARRAAPEIPSAAPQASAPAPYKQKAPRRGAGALI